MSEQKNKNSKNGFAAFYLTVLILAVIFAISVSISILTFGQQKISQNITKSSQAYYASEAGLEDALLKLVKKISWSSPYNLKVGNATATVEISDVIGGSRTITSTGNSSDRIRKIQVAYSVSTQQISFYYGAQVGDGGIQMQDTAKIEGNVFSNGSIIGVSKQKITGSAIVARNGNKIEQLDIGGDAKVHTCKDSIIAGTLTYVSGGSVQNCTVGGTTSTQPNEILPKDLPISQSQIDEWKNEALSGGVISGDYILSGTQKSSLGPKKIEGNLTIQDQAELSFTGTIWVTGNITLQNKARVYLDSNTYGSNSGVIIADGKITVQDTAKAKGSGLAGSYLMLLSTLDSGQNAIILQNSPEVDIVYASNGFVLLQNSIRLREVSSWGLKLQNQAQVIYEVGLEDTSFTSGPGGSWEVVSWREIE